MIFKKTPEREKEENSSIWVSILVSFWEAFRIMLLFYVLIILPSRLVLSHVPSRPSRSSRPSPSSRPFHPSHPFTKKTMYQKPPTNSTFRSSVGVIFLHPAQVVLLYSSPARPYERHGTHRKVSTSSFVFGINFVSSSAALLVNTRFARTEC